MRIAFLTRIQRRFNGETLYHEPLGGTQSAMIYLARELVALGHEAHIFCNCKDLAGEVDGVHYANITQLARFARQNPLDIFVSVADEQALKLGIPAKLTLWWSHNDYCFLWDEMPDLRAQFAQILGMRTDKLIAVSNWHADKLAQVFQIPREHFFVSRNGVHWPYFDAEPQPAYPPRLIYSSVPDRGLDLLLDLFPAIQAKVPEVELHLYSSFKVWGKDTAWDENRAGSTYQRAREMSGVFLQDPLPHGELAQRLLAGYAMVYPNNNHAVGMTDLSGFWGETSCIAAMEAQAAGLPVITSDRAALPETVEHGKAGLIIPGEPYSEAYNQAFIEATVGLLKERDRRDKLGQYARQRMQTQHSWKAIAKDFAAYFEQADISTRMAAPPFTSPFPTPTVSVIIPTYNRARNLKHCLESLTWQDFKAFEVIICDDGSQDNTRAVADSYKDRLNLRYRFQEDLGFRAAEARNMGIRAARGKLFVFLDSDLVVPSTFLSAHIKAHEQHQKVVVNSFVYRMLEEIDDDLGMPPQEYIAKHQDILKPDSRVRYELFQRSEPVEETYFLDSNALSILRSDLELFGGFDGEFVGWGHEDTELGYRIARHDYRLLLIKEGAAAYHQYHQVAENKDEDQKVNWDRLREKHGITTFYHPLWELDIGGRVRCQIQGDTSGFLPPILDGEWQLKTGHRAPLGNIHYTLQIEDGILKAILPWDQAPF